ncbi:MAG: protein kinase, partial [Kiritimatiellae bacterium]|nr:protein kinase [Kiritimatiellia bacterium]
MTSDSINDAVTMRPGGGAVLGRIDQYELVRELGGGGFGTVYLARDAVAGIEVAVKGLPPIVKNNAEELERIRENFALVSRLHHPYIAAALHLQLARDVAYSSEDARQKLRVMPGDTLMVMEYAPGVTLTKWRKQFPAGKVPLEQAIRLAWQIAQALDYAHGQRIIHRDIKPSNIMVETRPDGEVVARLLDFGLAAEVRSSMGRVSREIHDTSGTRPYMAPEQWMGRRQGPATDQYALAVMFNELVTGEVPFASVFETGDPVMMMNIVGNKPFEADRELPKAVRLSLEKALAKKPEERFASCVEFVGALEGKGHIRKERKWVGKAIAVLVLLAALGGGAWWWQERRTPAPRDPQVPVASQAQVAT